MHICITFKSNQFFQLVPIIFRKYLQWFILWGFVRNSNMDPWVLFQQININILGTWKKEDKVTSLFFFFFFFTFYILHFAQPLPQGKPAVMPGSISGGVCFCLAVILLTMGLLWQPFGAPWVDPCRNFPHPYTSAGLAQRWLAQCRQPRVPAKQWCQEPWWMLL